MNLIFNYWYFAPSFCIALAAAYFAYRVLAGHVNTPEKAVKRAYEERVWYVLGRINKKNGVCECNSVGVRIGVLSPPCDYCKGLKAGAPKEVEVNPLEVSLPLMWQTCDNLDLYEWTMCNVYQLPLSPKLTAYEILGACYAKLAPLPGTPACFVDKSCDIEGKWVFEYINNDFSCIQKPKGCALSSTGLTSQSLKLYFPSYKYDLHIDKKKSPELSIMTVKSKPKYFEDKECRRLTNLTVNERNLEAFNKIVRLQNKGVYPKYEDYNIDEKNQWSFNSIDNGATFIYKWGRGLGEGENVVFPDKVPLYTSKKYDFEFIEKKFPPKLFLYYIVSGYVENKVYIRISKLIKGGKG